MSKLIAITALLILAVFIFLSFNKTKDKKPFVSINNKVFEVFVAKTDEEKAKGLSIYGKLPPDKGMIFIFETPGYYSFWMKDMKFPIDIIYIQNNRIIDIFQNVSPPQFATDEPSIYKSKEKANYVLEINANLSKQYNFKVGDIVKINL